MARKPERKEAMSNVILFPACIRVGDWWCHGGRKYKHVGILKSTISPKDWERVYQFDLRRFLRGELCAADSRRGGGNAA
jgi:hypothetical protein